MTTKNADPSGSQRCRSDRRRREARRLIAVAMLVAVAGVGCAAPPDPSVSDPSSRVSAPASWQPAPISWPPASIAPGAGVDHACVLSESQAEAILGRDVAAPEVREGAYDNVACGFARLNPDSDLPLDDIFIEMSPPGFNTEPTDQPAASVSTYGDQANVIRFAIGDRDIRLSWVPTGDETDEQLDTMALAFFEAISANWSSKE